MLFRSIEGQGSTFWFTAAVSTHIEKNVSHITGKPSNIATVAPALFKGLRVLLVDDNELNRLVGQELLEEAGFVVDLSCDGQQAVDTLTKTAEGHYSAILMDIMMPILDGISATEHIRRLAQGKHIPIIAVSANSSSEYIERYTAAGMSAYISKPINEQQMWHVLEQHISQSVASLIPKQQATPAATDFNQQHLNSLHSSMGDARFLELLSKLVDDYQTRLTSIKNWDTLTSTPSIQQNIHDLISTAGHAGFHQLSKHALQPNNALHNNETQQVAVLKASIQKSLQDTIDYLEVLAKTLP